MLESDGGVFKAYRFRLSGSEAARAQVTEIAQLLKGIWSTPIGPGGGGADIEPSVRRAANIPAMSLEVEGNYFLIHHTQADTVDKIEPADYVRAPQPPSLSWPTSSPTCAEAPAMIVSDVTRELRTAVIFPSVSASDA